MTTDKKEGLRKIRSFISPNRAQIYKALLESNSIECAIWNEQSSLVTPYAGMINLDLMVRSEDYDRAKEIMAASFDEEDLLQEEQMAEHFRAQEP